MHKSHPKTIISAKMSLGEDDQTITHKANQPHVLSHPSSPPPQQPLVKMVLAELRAQRGIALPLVAMNLAWFAKTTITTAFLSRLGELNLAAGALGLSFTNVTGLSVLNGLCGAMEPLCGQAHGAKNIKLLHKTLLMTTLLLLMVTIPISFLWLNIDKILILLGQQQEIAIVAKSYVSYLLPNLVVTSLLCPLRAYLSSQCSTLPTLFSSAISLAFHVPVNILLSKAMGLRGVAMAVWITDSVVVVVLATYVWILECSKRNGSRWKEGGWWDQNIIDWIVLLKLCGSCCLNTCLEWWCYEILVLLAGHLSNAKQSLGVLAIVLNFDYLLYSVMLSLGTSVSTRVSNELGANQPGQAYRSACVSMAIAIITGSIGSLVMVAARGTWGAVFSHNASIIKVVKKMMLLMAFVEVFNFPLNICGGIVRGTARPWLGMYANLCGFYFIALPLDLVFAFKLHLGLAGLFVGLLIGVVSCFILLLTFIARINWMDEAAKAQTLVCAQVQEVPRHDDVNHVHEEQV